MQWRKKLDVLAYRGEAQEERLEVKNAPCAEPEREDHRQQEVYDEPHVPETVPIDVRATLRKNGLFEFSLCFVPRLSWQK